MMERFLEYLKAQVGCVYVWGGQGETDITEAWIRRRETSEANALRAIAFWKKQQAAGVSPLAAYDCSGLIAKFLMDNRLSKSDISSRGLYSACDRIDREELREGDLVFRHNGEKIYHVGVYIGEGEVIEAKGRDDGVVRRKLNASGSGYWNRFGRLPLLTKAGESGQTGESEQAAAGEAQDEGALAQPSRPAFPALYSYGGASYVFLRTQPDASAEAIGRVERKARALVLTMADGWAEVVIEDGGGYLRGWCSATHLEKI